MTSGDADDSGESSPSTSMATMSVASLPAGEDMARSGEVMRCGATGSDGAEVVRSGATSSDGALVVRSGATAVERLARMERWLCSRGPRHPGLMSFVLKRLN